LIKRFKSVVNSFAHHSVSSLSYIHPHLGVACLEQGIGQIKIDLLNQSFEPELKKENRQIKQATQALVSKLYEIAETENISQNDLVKAEILFQFKADQWPHGALVKAQLNNHKPIQVCVDHWGCPAEIIYWVD